MNFRYYRSDTGVTTGYVGSTLRRSEPPTAYFLWHRPTTNTHHHYRHIQINGYAQACVMYCISSHRN